MSIIRVWGEKEAFDIPAEDAIALKRVIPSNILAFRLSDRDTLDLYIPVSKPEFVQFMHKLVEAADLSVDEFIELLKDQ